MKEMYYTPYNTLETNYRSQNIFHYETFKVDVDMNHMRDT